MVSFKIRDVKDFMSCLLKEETFDDFKLIEVEVRTFCTMKLYGKRWKEWYEKEGGEADLSNVLEWREVKPIVYGQIRGNKPPLYIKAVLSLDGERKIRFVQNVDSSFSPDEVSGLLLNICYDREGLSIITGVSLQGFHPDKRIEQAWDENVRKLLKNKGINVE